MAYPRYRAARAHKFFTRTAGNLTLNSTALADLPTIGTTWDITLAAQVGDVVRVELSGLWGSEVVEAYLDVYSIVSAAAVSSWSGAATSGGGWYGAAGSNPPVAGTYRRAVTAGDLSSGSITLRPRYRTVTAANKTLFAVGDHPLHFAVDNLGPADPN